MLVDQSIITSLPPDWDTVSPQQAEAYPLEARRYADLVAQLQDLASQRSEAAARVARLQRMRDLLAPFGDIESVQENLVTRNSEVEAELQRMRMLLARVGGRVSQLKDQRAETGSGSASRNNNEDDDQDDVMIDVEAEEQRKVGQLLENF